MDCTFVVSNGEVEVPSSLGGERKQKVMVVVWLIAVHGTKSLNDLKVKRQMQYEVLNLNFRGLSGFIL